jgi:hypothetical protein
MLVALLPTNEGEGAETEHTGVFKILVEMRTRKNIVHTPSSKRRRLEDYVFPIGRQGVGKKPKITTFAGIVDSQSFIRKL